MDDVGHVGNTADLVGNCSRKGQIEATSYHVDGSARMNAGGMVLVKLGNLLSTPGRLGWGDEVGDGKRDDEEDDRCCTTTGAVVLNGGIAQKPRARQGLRLAVQPTVEPHVELMVRCYFQELVVKMDLTGIKGKIVKKLLKFRELGGQIKNFEG